jgi:tripartite ATP-independent transporter DctM subunit
VELAAIVLVCSFVFFLLMNVPIAVSIGTASMLALLLEMPTLPAVTQIAQKVATGLDSFPLLAIPFFILSGNLMRHGGIAHRLINLAKVLVGRLPGGLAFVDIMACMMFGAISGSAVAAASAIGGFMIPIMNEEGYEKNFNTSVTITAATTGLLIPPSNLLIIYSLASGGVSVAALFIAGYVPGILTGLMLMAVAGVTSVVRKYPAGQWVAFRQAMKILWDALPSLLLIFIVIGGIIAGVFTATEAAAVAVVYSFFLSVVFYREIKLKDLPGIFLETVVTNSVVLMLIATSMALSWVMSYENIPQTVSATLLGLTDSKIVILLIINVVLLAVGTFMDATPAVLIFTPIFLPVVVNLGMDPLHFGMVLVMNLCVGICTPPVGTCLFVGCAVAKTSIVDVIRPLMPFFLAMVAALLMITYIPELVLFLPRMLGF